MCSKNSEREMQEEEEEEEDQGRERVGSVGEAQEVVSGGLPGVLTLRGVLGLGGGL